MIYCNYCGKPSTGKKTTCPHCGRALPTAIPQKTRFRAQPPNPSPGPQASEEQSVDRPRETVSQRQVLTLKGPKLRLGETLVEAGMITVEQLRYALDRQQELKLKLGKILVLENFIDESQLVQALSHQSNIPWINLWQVEIPDYLKGLIPLDLCQKYAVFPIDKRKARNRREYLYLAMEDVKDRIAIESIAKVSGMSVQPIFASESAIMATVESHRKQLDDADEPAVSSDSPTLVVDSIHPQPSRDDTQRIATISISHEKQPLPFSQPKAQVISEVGPNDRLKQKAALDLENSETTSEAATKVVEVIRNTDGELEVIPDEESDEEQTEDNIAEDEPIDLFEQVVTEDKQVVAEDKQVVAEDDQVTKEDKQVVAEDEQVVAEDEQVVAEDEQVVAEDEQVVAEDEPMEAADPSVDNSDPKKEPEAVADDGRAPIPSSTLTLLDGTQIPWMNKAKSGFLEDPNRDVILKELNALADDPSSAARLKEYMTALLDVLFNKKLIFPQEIIDQLKKNK